MSDAQKEPIIFLDDISVTFKTRTGSLLHPNLVHAVNHVTIKLMPGETIGIVGESGCGKSTTANVMCGLQSPTSGKVYQKEPIIFLDDISVTFKTRTGSLLHPNLVHAVNHVTIKLMPGETIGIVGESGCGKSTTANVMCGLQSPTSGKVYFKGEDVTKRTSDLRKKMGRVVSVVFQDPATALNPRMIVHDQLLDPLLVHKVGSTAEQEKRIKELIELVGLPKSALRAMPGQLSGGQRQRVAIARAISLKPDAIIADEPTSALDVSVRAQILNLLTDLKKDLGLSMMFISHDIQTVRSPSDKSVALNQGQIMEEGPATQVFENPQDPYPKMLLGAAPSLLHPNLGK